MRFFKKFTALICAVAMAGGLFITPAMAAKAVNFYEINRAAMDLYTKDPEEAAKYHLLPNVVIEQEIIELAQSITDGLTDDYQKLKAIHDWVAQNIYYDYNKSEEDYPDSSAITTLRDKSGVCEGYGNLTEELCRAVGIPCRYIRGLGGSFDEDNLPAQILNAYNEFLKTGDIEVYRNAVPFGRNFFNLVTHGWNAAFIDGRWVVLDATWDSNNKRRGDNFTSGKMTDKYFDSDLQEFSQDHLFSIAPDPVHIKISMRIGDKYMLVDGQAQEVDPGRDTVPIIIDGRTMVPARAVVEALGGSVEWKPESQRIGIEVSGRTNRLPKTSIELQIGNKEFSNNGLLTVLDAAPQIVDGRTLVPIGAIARCITNCQVEWIEDTQTVNISYLIYN